MSERLQQQLVELKTLEHQLPAMLHAGAQPSVTVTRTASDTARTMVNEVLDWRVIFQDQPLRTT